MVFLSSPALSRLIRSICVIAIVAVPFVVACGDSPTSVSACGDLPYFTTLPVAEADFDLVVVIGGLGAPGHTLPTAHTGFALAREGARVVSPGDLILTRVRSVTYTESPNRQGETDYAVFFRLCADVEGWFGHLTSLSAAIPAATGEDCETYSTPIETVRSCESSMQGVTVSAGELLGTGGLSIELGLMGLDFGLLDERVQNLYVNPSRYPDPMFHSVCPFEYFDATNRETLLSSIRDPARPEVEPAGEPRCGTMAVDVVGTAKGVWAEVGVTGAVTGDETRYITLANYPYRPQEQLALSLGPAALGARVAVTARETSGRVNRAFDQVTGDGLVYCYSDESGTDSWFLALSPGGNLTLEWLQHGQGESPCQLDPESWAFGGSAMTFVR